MIELIPTPSHVVAFRLAGKITSDDIDRISNALDDTLEEFGSAAFLMEVTDLGGMSFKALLKDLRYSFRHIGHMERFTRGAVVTDTKWLRTAADWEGKLVPGIEVRGFELEESEDAMAWVVQPVLPPAPMLLRFDTYKPDLYAYALKGTVTGHDVRRVSTELEEAYAEHGSIDLLVRIEKLSGFRPSVFGEHIFHLQARSDEAR